MLKLSFALPSLAWTLMTQYSAKAEARFHPQNKPGQEVFTLPPTNMALEGGCLGSRLVGERVVTCSCIHEHFPVGRLQPDWTVS